MKSYKDILSKCEYDEAGKRRHTSDVGWCIREHLAKEFETAPNNLDTINLKLLNTAHTYQYDKWYRMGSGASSEILSFKDYVLELKIASSRSVLIENDAPSGLTINIVKTWLSEPILSKTSKITVNLFSSIDIDECTHLKSFEIDVRSIDTST